MPQHLRSKLYRGSTCARIRQRKLHFCNLFTSDLCCCAFCSIIQAVHEFIAFFCGTFADATTTIKMHLLEDHDTQWANATHVGFGLLGEQGAESIHAKCNRLRPGICTHKRVKQLQCIVKEHLLSIEPQIVAAIPPPT